MRAIVLTTLGAAAVVFAIVQDRVTADGARQYATRQRGALAGRGAAITIDAVMVPAVRRSVGQAAAWAGVVIVVGLGAAAAASKRHTGE